MANLFIRSRQTTAWAASHAYSLGDKVVSTTGNKGVCFEVTTAGTSGGSEPTWTNGVGNTTTDNGVTWTCRGNAGIWTVNTAYNLGDRVVKVGSSTGSYNNSSATVWECTTAGTSHATTEPTWPTTVTAGTTTQTDNTVTWTARKASTWDNAHPYMAALFADSSNSTIIVNGGDTVYVSNAHHEQVTPAAFTTQMIDMVKSGGASQTPIRVLCVSDTGQPSSPSTLATTAIVELIGSPTAASVYIAGSAYVYGITMKSSTTSTTHIGVAGSSSSFSSKMEIKLENCGFTLGSGSSSQIQLGEISGSGPDPGFIELINPTFTGGNSSQALVTINYGKVKIRGGSLAGTLPSSGSSVFNQITNNVSFLEVDGFDFSALGSTTPIVRNFASCAGYFLFRNCKITSGGTLTALPTIGTMGLHSTLLDFINYGSGGTNYRMHREHGCGTVDEETVKIKSGGFSDGTTGLSHKMISNANASFFRPLEGFGLNAWNDNSGSSKTATVEILTDSATQLNNDDVWLELEYLADSGDPLAGFGNNAKASTLAANAAQPTSSATWTTTGISNVMKQTLQISFTPQQKGAVRGKVMLGKASATIYVDPKLTIT